MLNPKSHRPRPILNPKSHRPRPILNPKSHRPRLSLDPKSHQAAPDPGHQNPQIDGETDPGGVAGPGPVHNTTPSADHLDMGHFIERYDGSDDAPSNQP
jgi:hypothetical protein